MITFDDLKENMREKLNGALSPEEFSVSPFHIYSDIGDIIMPKRDGNTIISKRNVIMRQISSNVTSLGTLKLSELTAEVEILIPIDEMEGETVDTLEYRPVREAKELIQSVAMDYTGKAETITKANDGMYSVIGVYNLGTLGNLDIAVSPYGEMVSMSFTVFYTIIENGINADNMTITLDDTELFVTNVSENMVASTEGRTHEMSAKSVFVVQEARYGIDFITPLTTNPICEIFLNALHNGVDNKSTLTLKVNYGQKKESGELKEYTHKVVIASVSLTSQRPSNIGLNISLVEADEDIPNAEVSV